MPWQQQPWAVTMHFPKLLDSSLGQQEGYLNIKLYKHYTCLEIWVLSQKVVERGRLYFIQFFTFTRAVSYQVTIKLQNTCSALNRVRHTLITIHSYLQSKQQWLLQTLPDNQEVLRKVLVNRQGVRKRPQCLRSITIGQCPYYADTGFNQSYQSKHEK